MAEKPSERKGWATKAIVGQGNGKRYPIQCPVLTSISSTGHPGKERALITPLTGTMSLQLWPGPVSGNPLSSTIGSDGWLLKITTLLASVSRKIRTASLLRCYGLLVV
jgi:hypothetical protein